MRKMFALYMIYILSLQPLLTNIVFALSEGPAQPEAMQFEPVDVTDVVNLATGDFVYTLPLIEVPGPNGGYPLALSYHSGIGMNQEATMVGLGWSLNPGAINRAVNGYPDDYKGAVVRTHFDSDEIKGYGVSIGMSYDAVGLNMSYDSFSGNFGINGTIGIKTKKGPLSLGFGTDGFSLKMGNNYGGLSIGTRGVCANVGFNANGGTIGIRGGFGYDGKGSVGLYINYTEYTGMSLSTNGVSINYLHNEAISLASVSSGNVKYNSIGIPIPYAPLSIGLSQTVWKLDEKYADLSYGYIYNDAYFNANEDWRKYERVSQDRYLYSSQDNYNVASQGVGGVFKPFLTKAFELLDNPGNEEKGELGDIGFSNHEAVFRFIGDHGANFITDDDHQWGDLNYSLYEDQYGSKLIQPHYDQESGKLTGFEITNVDGARYEFTQPVYNNLLYTWSKANEDGTDFVSESDMGSSYATSWYLTSIKGPDYIDNGDLGLSGDDWGYWVKFSYSVKDEQQIWRSPYTGYAPSPDDETVQNYSMGMREIVYLDTIQTKTHLAIFEKTLSADRKSASFSSGFYLEQAYKGAYATTNATALTISGNWVKYLDNLDSDEDFLELRYTNGGTYNVWYNKSELYKTSSFKGYLYNESLGTTVVVVPRPVQSVIWGRLYPERLISGVRNNTDLLDKIVLYSKSDPDISQQGGIWNVVNATSLKTVDFTYDYSLCNGTPTSEGYGGKLTLTHVDFKGIDGATGLPGYSFAYENSNPDYNANDWDNWGSYRDPATSSPSHLSPQVKNLADNAKAWGLKEITVPTGGTITVEYESDDYWYVNDENTTDLSKVAEHMIDDPGINVTRDYFTSSNVEDMELVEGQAVYLIQHETYINDNPEPDPSTITHSYDLTLFHVESISGNIVYINGDYTYLVDESPVWGGYSEYDYAVFVCPQKVMGGGVRVRSITSSDGKTAYKTVYKYENENGTSSGATASLPALYGAKKIIHNISGANKYFDAYMDHEHGYGRPAPSVIYSKVVVQNVDPFDNDIINGKTDFEFYTAKDVQYEVSESSTSPLLTITDVAGLYGRPKAITYYEKTPDSQLRPIKNEEFRYEKSSWLGNNASVYHKNDNPVIGYYQRPLGIIQEKYKFRNYFDPDDLTNNVKKWIDKTYESYYEVGKVSNSFYYDSPTSVAHTGEIVSESKNFLFDALSGQVIGTAFSNSESGTQITKSVPAYWKYPGMESNNMLSQTTQEISYKTDIDISNDNSLNTYFGINREHERNEDLVYSTITTWSNLWTIDGIADPVWRKNDTYTYNKQIDIKDGSYHIASFDPWTNKTIEKNYPTVTSSSPWKMTSNITKYSPYSQPIESVGEDGSYSATLNGYNEALPIAIATNARVSEIIYDNFENESGEARTGNQGMVVTGTLNFDVPEEVPEIGGNYILEVWAKPSSGNTITVNAQIDGPDQTVTSSNISEWQLLILRGVPNLADIRIYGNGVIDDYRVYPERGNMSTFTYHPLTRQVTSMTNTNNITTFYEYDELGRLILVRDQDGNILTYHEYIYGRNN